jgi:hypothetical protein
MFTKAIVAVLSHTSPGDILTFYYLNINFIIIFLDLVGLVLANRLFFFRFSC